MSTWVNVTHNVSTQFVPSFDHFLGTIQFYKFLFALIDGVAIIGNILVIFTILLNPNMRSTVHYQLANLAISDFLFASLAPFHTSMLLDNYNWKYGATFCRIYYFIFRSFYAFSVINLMLITVARFQATQRPISFQGNKKRTLTIIMGTWVLSFIFSSPFISVMGYRRFTLDYSSCFQMWPGKLKRRAYYVFVYTVLYFIPLVLMAFMYARMSMTLCKPPPGSLNDTQRGQFRARKRMSLVVIVIVIAFFICWSPWNIIEFTEIVHDEKYMPFQRFPTIKNYAMLAVILNTAVNPILLNFMSLEFRKGLRLAFVRISSWCRLLRGSGNGPPTGSNERN